MDPLDRCKCRRPTLEQEALQEGTESVFISNQLLKHQAAQQLFIRRHGLAEVRSIDPVTGREVKELIGCFTNSVEWNLGVLGACMIAVVLLLLGTTFFM